MRQIPAPIQEYLAGLLAIHEGSTRDWAPIEDVSGNFQRQGYLRPTAATFEQISARLQEMNYVAANRSHIRLSSHGYVCLFSLGESIARLLHNGYDPRPQDLFQKDYQQNQPGVKYTVSFH